MPLPTPDKPSQQQRIQTEYTQYYQYYNADSHPSQRATIIKQIYILIEAKEKEKESPPLRILDIGSGPQLLEKELFAKYPELTGKVSIITLDIASIQPTRLETKLPHIQADAAHLPFKKDSFDLVISNMALDFVAPKGNERRKQLFQEIYRILKSQGRLVATLHHPSLEIDYFTYRNITQQLNNQNQELGMIEIQDESKKNILIQQDKIAINDARFRYWEIHKYVFQDINDITQFINSLSLKAKDQDLSLEHPEGLTLFKILKIKEMHKDGEKWFYIELEKNNLNATIN